MNVAGCAYCGALMHAHGRVWVKVRCKQSKLKVHVHRVAAGAQGDDGVGVDVALLERVHVDDRPSTACNRSFKAINCLINADLFPFSIANVDSRRDNAKQSRSLQHHI